MKKKREKTVLLIMEETESIEDIIHLRKRHNYLLNVCLFYILLNVLEQNGNMLRC